MLLAACGGDGGTSDDANGSEADPTTTPFPTFAFFAPTTPPVFHPDSESTDDAALASTAAADETEVVELDPKLVERGRGRYEALECGVCHGDNGEGTDDIGGLLDMQLTEDEFTTFMRSGGDIGSSHQYSTDRLSKNGSTNLYLYLLSLAQDS